MLNIQKKGQQIRRVITPSSIEETLSWLDQLGPSARLIAGGTDLLIELDRNQRAGVDTLIDLTRIPGLDDIVLGQNRSIFLGPTVTHNQVIDSDLIVTHGFPLAQAALEVGSPALRNRATVVGNLVTASPANDTLTPLMAMGAVLTLRSAAAGERKVPLDQFYTGLRQTVLRPAEMVTGLSFPALNKSQHGIYVKLGLRKAQAISVVHLAIVLEFEAGRSSEIKSARITLGSVAPTVIPVAEAEQMLIGQTLDADRLIDSVAEAIAAFPVPIDDLRGTAEYRTHMLKVMAVRAFEALRDGEERSQWPERPVLLDSATSNRLHPAATFTPDVTDRDPIEATVNGHSVSAAQAAGKTLLDWLREEVRLPAGQLATGTKEGCAEGECGACTVFMDGKAVLSCLVPATRAAGSDIVTVEGLAEAEDLHPIQDAFVATGAVQCGYCIPGFLMAGAKLLETHAVPTEADILQGLSGNLCRCTGYYKIVDAVKLAAEMRQQSIKEG